MAHFSRRGRGGNNIIEFCFLVPWFIFLFVGVFDYGFYAYSLISTMTAAHVAANYCSANSTNAANCAASNTVPCGYALDTLRDLPNVGSSLTTCSTSPVTVTATYSSPAARVTVVYVTPQLIPIPGLLPGQLTITKTVQMMARS